MARGDGSLQQHPGRIARPVEEVVVVENAFRAHPVLGENGRQPRLSPGQQVPGYGGGIGTVQQNRELTGDRFFHGADLLGKTLAKFFQ